MLFVLPYRYCANRIFKFAQNGTMIKMFGPEDPFKVPHSMALAEDQDLLCVADRENKR